MKQVKKIIVKGKLVKPHPQIKTAKEALEQGFIDRFGTLYPPAFHDDIPNVRVSQSQLNRALRIMDALFKAIETNEGKIKVIKQENRRDRQTLVCILGHEVEIKLEELSKKSEPYRHLRARGETCYYKPTGKLRLKIDSWVDRKQPAINDDENYKIEDQLNVFLAMLYQQASRMQLAAKQTQMWRERHQREKAEHRKRRQEEETRIKDLEAQIEAFDKAKKIRNYVQSLSKASVSKDPAWTKWALNYADSIDPTIQELDDSSQKT